ncbi:MAG TPA: tol-pal system protein YbgF [Thiopseudomonas sp.]|nr:tol-pal system protein YbgF [Thiopseudomonas sp.]
MIRSTLIALALSLPTLAVAAIPITDGSGLQGMYAGANQGLDGAVTGGGASAPLSAQGQLFMQLQQMQEEISMLRGMLEEQQHELRQVRQENLERYQTLDSRLHEGVGAQAPGPSTATEQASGSPAGQQSAADPEKEKLLYEASFDLIKARDFETAKKAFNAFLNKYPNSQYAGNAQYWLGEVYLVDGDLQSAGQAFALVTNNYPQHNKVPDSLYKLADVERRLGHADKARTIMQQVVAQYPNTSAAQLAQQDLRKL